MSNGSSSPRSSGRWTRSSRFAILPGTCQALDPSIYLTREYAPLPQRLQGFLGYARAIPAPGGRHPREPAARRWRGLHRARPWRRLAAMPVYRGEMPAIVCASGRRRPASENSLQAIDGRRSGHGRTVGLARIAARHRRRQLCTGRGEIRADVAHHRAGGGAARRELRAVGRGDLRAEPGGSRRGLRVLRAQDHARRVCRPMRADKPAAARWRPRARNSPSCGSS